MKIKYYIYIVLSFLFLTSVQANDKNVDCLILDDENSIICKYTHTRLAHDKTISVQWIEPNNQITRSREMIIPAQHGSVYDFRYKEGRTKGIWTFKVIDSGDEYSTTFTIE